MVGKVDATLWYVVGVGQYLKYTKDKKFLEEFSKSIEKAMNYLFSLELNGKGFLYIPTGGDWADEYITHGYVLFDEILYFQALKEYELILKKTNKPYKEISKKRKNLQEMIVVNFFPEYKKRNSKRVYNKELYLKILKKFNYPYAMSYFSSDGFSKRLDCFANSLLLLSDISKRKYKERVISHLGDKLDKQKIKILPAFWPPINSRSSFWKILKMNSLFSFRNKPHYYHNGGLWPLIQGFFIASLAKEKKKKRAKEFLDEFSKTLTQGKYIFNEYYDSKKYKPRGIRRMGFSAAGYILAYTSTIENKRIFL